MKPQDAASQSNPAVHPERPMLIIIRGLPGGGKTFLAAALEKSFDKDHLVALDPDATDYQSPEYAAHTQALSAEGVDLKLHAYRFLRNKAYQGIAERKTIIWNQPFTNLEIFNKMMANLRLQAEEHQTQLLVLVVEVEVDPALAKQRIEERKRSGGHGPSDGTFARFLGDYHSFEPYGYHTVTVRGEDNVEASVATIMAAVHELRQRQD